MVPQKEKQATPLLLSPFSLGPFELRNRVVALPIHTGFALPDGRVSPWMLDWYARMADSGASLVVVANTAVSADGVVSGYNLRADRDDHIPGLGRLARTIKERGAVACIQLNHAGRFAKTARPLLPSPIIHSNLAFNVESLKAFMEFFPFEKRFRLTRHLYAQIKTWGSAMTEKDRDRVVRDFATAAARAWQAGFDMVELHGANGYLICQFLSSFTHRPSKADPGSGFALDIIRAVRRQIPGSFPIGFRLILREWVPGGIDLDQALAFAGLLEKAAVTYVSVSAGTYNSLFSPEVLKKTAAAAYLEADAAALRALCSIPVIIAGRVTRPAQGEALLRRGAADLIGIGRALRADPGWLHKAGKPDRKIIPCINCNHCLKQVVLEKGFACRQWSIQKQEKTKLAHQMLSRRFHPLWVMADRSDLDIFKAWMGLLLPKDKEKARISVLFLNPLVSDPEFNSLRKGFLSWLKGFVDPLGISSMPCDYSAFASEEDREKAVLEEVIQGCHGQVFLAAVPGQAWRERLLYRIRGRVLGLLSASRDRDRVVVPVDLSETALLVMQVVGQTLMARSGVHLDFVHVTDRDGRDISRRWKDCKAIAGLDEAVPLICIKGHGDVAAALTRHIRRGRYGTVAMGKRGISHMKRWLLGSVSAGVLRQLTHHSLFLID